MKRRTLLLAAPALLGLPAVRVGERIHDGSLRRRQTDDDQIAGDLCAATRVDQRRP